MMVLTPGNGAAFQRRTATGGVSDNTSLAGWSAPSWVRLTRRGNTLTGYVSSNGTTWTLVGAADVPMSTTAYVGLCVTAHNNGTLSTATFTNVDQPPVLGPIPDQTVSSGQQVITVPLSASDPDGNPLTFSATAQSLAYVLTQQTGTLTYDSSSDNSGGRGERWLHSASNRWYFILANGELYQWDGGSGANGTLLGNVGTSYWSDPTRLTNPPVDQPHATFSFDGNNLLITRDLAWFSGLRITVTVNDGQLTDSKTFTLTVTDQPPVLGPIPNQTIPASQQVLSVTLSATDPDGDPLTFTVTAQSLAYVLTQQTGTLTYVSKWDNSGGRGEKWLQAPSGQWYFILANGDLYQWDGNDGASGTVLGTVGASYYDDPTRLTDPPANEPHAVLTLTGDTLLITRDLAWVSGLQITVTVSDGLLTDSKTFTVTVTR
jgi:hypothetical protein